MGVSTGSLKSTLFFVKIIFALICIVFLIYLSLPNFAFPKPPGDFLQSNEPADVENPLRKAYFTNLSREEVLTYYKNELIRSVILNIKLPTYRLNYPPEEAQTIIRDQTRSTFLEEIVHPLRESFYINGFEPKDPKDSIYIEGNYWRQKITVRYIPTNLFIRLLLGITDILLIILIGKEWMMELNKFNK